MINAILLYSMICLALIVLSVVMIGVATFFEAFRVYLIGKKKDDIIVDSDNIT